MANKKLSRIRRKLRVKHHVAGSAARPRLSIYRSNRYIYGQVVNDEKGITVMALSSRTVKLDDTKDTNTPTMRAAMVGKQLAGELLKKKIKTLVFDRNGYRYHGQVRALAEGLRKAGITV